MLSLIYVSTARVPITDSMVESLAAEAAKNNSQHQITGLLAYNSRSFMQLLEGEGDTVLATMHAIERDSRHENIVYIRQDSRFGRECPEWSMRSLITPVTGIGSVKVFTGALPSTMEMDTKILFSSFASALSASGATRHAENEQDFRDRDSAASND